VELFPATRHQPAVVKVVAVNTVQVAEPVISEVHAGEITETHAVPRNEWLAKTQRTPAKAAAEADAKSEAAAIPGD
jgi:hypothetical protein